MKKHGRAASSSKVVQLYGGNRQPEVHHNSNQGCGDHVIARLFSTGEFIMVGAEDVNDSRPCEERSHKTAGVG